MADKKSINDTYRQILIYGVVALVAAFIGFKVGGHGGRNNGYGKGGSGHKGAAVLFRIMKSAGSNGLAIEEIEKKVSTFLSEADKDGDGNLTRQEMKRAMKRVSRK